MGWNKNTITDDSIDKYVSILVESGLPHRVILLGEVKGNGLNDPDGKKYPIRRLEYRGMVVLEQMHRHPDCDVDDIIVTYKFTKEDAPAAWEIETSVPMELENDSDFDKE